MRRKESRSLCRSTNNDKTKSKVTEFTNSRQTKVEADDGEGEGQVEVVLLDEIVGGHLVD
jgi:hypothetical protein